MIKYLQLSQCFDAGKMQQEIDALHTQYWKQHYNTNNFQGQWTVLPLRSVGGTIENIVSVHASATKQTVYKDTALLQGCTYLQTVINYFECEKTAVRLMKLHAGAIIKEHTDHDMNFEEGEARFHIPVITNPQVNFILDDERVPMLEGECWYLNLSLKHSVTNRGNADRIHLVIDCIVNDWVRDLFATQYVQRKMTEPKVHHQNKSDTLQIIKELRLMNTATATALAEKMEKEL